MCKQIQFLLNPDLDLARYLAGYLDPDGYPAKNGSGSGRIQKSGPGAPLFSTQRVMVGSYGKYLKAISQIFLQISRFTFYADIGKKMATAAHWLRVDFVF